MRMSRVLGRTVLALLASVALVVTGLGYWGANGLLGGIATSLALEGDAPRSTGGAMNILLIGLDSRKDQDGNDLPDDVLDKLHAGDSGVGGYNTNTLILVHISADDRVVAFSIPRDDYVAVSGIDGHDHIKIKEAYGLTKGQTEDALHDEGVTDAAELERRGREAGRQATLRAVRTLTGQPIDYFAEVNLAGFYDLAASLGGVEVCLNHAVYDDFSGADFPAGRQTLDGAQALAFVRQRHGLQNGDLDRTHRQQAFLLSVMHNIQSSGGLSDLGTFRALMTVARKDLVLSQGWDEKQFRRIGALAGGDMTFQTLPVLRYDYIDGQDVNIVDPAAIRAQIAAAIAGSPISSANVATSSPSPGTEVVLVNASDSYRVAAQAADVMGRKGYAVRTIRNRHDGEPRDTVVDYGPGTERDATTLADLLGTPTPAQADSTVPAGTIRVILGPGYEVPANSLEPATTTTNPITTANLEAASQGASDTTVLPKPDAGAPVDGGNAIPCVN